MNDTVVNTHGKQKAHGNLDDTGHTPHTTDHLRRFSSHTTKPERRGMGWLITFSLITLPLLCMTLVALVPFYADILDCNKIKRANFAATSKKVHSHPDASLSVEPLPEAEQQAEVDLILLEN